MFSGKISKTDIEQTTGASTTSVMSQKAVSDALSKKADLTNIQQTIRAGVTWTNNIYLGDEAYDLSFNRNGDLTYNGDKVMVGQTVSNEVSLVQNPGQSTTSVMSQKAVNDALSTKVGKSDITQSTGTSTTAVMSQKAVSDALSTKVDKTDITQSTGTSTTAVMSQKAVSDALSNSGFALLYELGFSDLRHFYASRVDADTATYYVDEGIPEWVRTCPMLKNRYALNIDRFFTDNNISIGSKTYTKQIKSSFVWIEIIDNNSFVAFQNYSGTLKSVIGDASKVGEFAFCEIAKGFKLDITGFSTVVFEIDKSVKNVLSSRYGLNGQTYSDLSVYRERGNKYYSPENNVNYIKGYIYSPCVATSSYSNIINIKRDNGNLEIEQAKINSSTLEIASTVNTVYENSVPLINPIVSDIQDEEKLYLSSLVYNYSAPLPYIPHTTIKVYGKK